MIATIYRTGLTGIDKPEPVQIWEGSSLEQLTVHLLEKQSGYCQGRERPYVTVSTATFNDRPRTIAKTHSPNVDWGYLAIIGHKTKKELTKE